MSKKKERTSPRPAFYNQNQWRSLHGKKKAMGSPAQSEERINFTENYVVPLKANPSPDKYNKPAMELTRDKNPNYAISKTHFPRFEYKKGKVNPSAPGPQSYEKDKAVDKNCREKTKLGTFTKGARYDYFTKHAKRNISPGPGTHKLVEIAKDSKLSSKLSTIATKRH